MNLLIILSISSRHRLALSTLSLFAMQYLMEMPRRKSIYRICVHILIRNLRKVSSKKGNLIPVNEQHLLYKTLGQHNKKGTDVGFFAFLMKKMCSQIIRGR